MPAVEAFDRIAGWAEVLLVPASLGLLLVACGLGGLRIWRWRLAGVLLVVWVVAGAFGVGSLVLGASFPFLAAVSLVARLARRWPGARKLAVPLVALTALTVAQPFGVRAQRLDHAEAQAALAGAPGDPEDTHSMDVVGVPIVRFTSYRRKIEGNLLAGLGECCPATHTLRVRSWVAPGLLTHATQIAEICGDEPCWKPGSSSLGVQETAGQRYLVLGDPDKPAEAWRLSFEVVSAWGVIYWMLAAGGVLTLLRRRRRRSDTGAADEGP